MRRVLWFATFALPVILLVPGTHAQAPGAPAQTAPATRPAPPPDPSVVGKDPNGNTLRLAKKTGHVSNYDEARAGSYALPDPLVKFDGTPVKTAADWKARRAEILKVYEEDIYGRIPANTPRVRWAVARAGGRRAWPWRRRGWGAASLRRHPLARMGLRDRRVQRHPA